MSKLRSIVFRSGVLASAMALSGFSLDYFAGDYLNKAREAVYRASIVGESAKLRFPNLTFSSYEDGFDLVDRLQRDRNNLADVESGLNGLSVDYGRIRERLDEFDTSASGLEERLGVLKGSVERMKALWTDYFAVNRQYQQLVSKGTQEVLGGRGERDEDKTLWRRAQEVGLPVLRGFYNLIGKEDKMSRYNLAQNTGELINMANEREDVLSLLGEAERDFISQMGLTARQYWNLAKYLEENPNLTLRNLDDVANELLSARGKEKGLARLFDSLYEDVNLSSDQIAQIRYQIDEYESAAREVRESIRERTGKGSYFDEVSMINVAFNPYFLGALGVLGVSGFTYPFRGVLKTDKKR